MDIKNFILAINQIAEEKGISQEKIIESIETAIAAAYKKDYGKKGQIVKAKLNPQTGEVNFWQVKLVVTPDMIYSEKELEELKKQGKDEKDEKDEKNEKDDKEKKVRFNPEKHILLEEAKKIKPDIKVGENLEIPLQMRKDYGRIAAQTAKQVVLQKIREAERETIFNQYKSKEDQLVSGIVQRVDGKNVFVDMGKVLGILPKEEQIYGEFYKPGQRLKFYVLKVEENVKGPVIFLSRAYPKLISRLFELEVPEISQGQVVIKAIAREAGSRSKIALESKIENLDPIGSAVGQRGTRIMAVINELGGEKIDVIKYSENPEEFIANSLSPAKVLEVKIMPKNRALCLVPEDQLSLAIGKNGQNVRLAAKLTGWKIDVKTVEEPLSIENNNETTIEGVEEEKKKEREEGKKEKEEKREEKEKEKKEDKENNKEKKKK